MRTYRHEWQGLSGHCDGKILQTTYDTGRTAFTVFVDKDGLATTMSGIKVDSYQLLFKAASELVFRLEGQQVDSKAKESWAATGALWAWLSS